MIDWGKTKSVGLAHVYLPGLKATNILDLAYSMYSQTKLTQIDDNTIGCPVGGVSYIPIPPSDKATYTGLLTIDVPNKLRKGQKFTVIVRQVTNAFGELPGVPDIPRIRLQPDLQAGPSSSFSTAS